MTFFFLFSCRLITSLPLYLVFRMNAVAVASVSLMCTSLNLACNLYSSDTQRQWRFFYSFLCHNSIFSHSDPLERLSFSSFPYACECLIYQWLHYKRLSDCAGATYNLASSSKNILSVWSLHCERFCVSLSVCVQDVCVCLYQLLSKSLIHVRSPWLYLLPIHLYQFELTKLEVLEEKTQSELNAD